MTTAVVSGRIDRALKAHADHIIQAAGYTTADVIKCVWQAIAQTGELPEGLAKASSRPKPTSQFDQFAQFVEALPPAPERFASMSDEELKQLLGERHV